AVHGAQKLFGVLGSSMPKPFTQLWFGGVIELVTGSAIAVGAFTMWAALLASGEMAVAYLQFHWKGAFNQRFFPVGNKGGLAALSSVISLSIAGRGPSRWSVDHKRSRR